MASQAANAVRTADGAGITTVGSHQGGLPVVIVGTGPVGIRTAQELLSRRPDTPVVIYGDEPWHPYNRVQLSALLSGELSLPAIDNALRVPEGATVVQHHNCAVVTVDREARTVTDTQGRVQPYSFLVLATGSRAHIPSIPGIESSGVYTFRDLDDAQRLLARRTRSRRTVVLGGGLLGLEAAKALCFGNTEVIVVEHTAWLMKRQLDQTSGEMLREHVLGLGVRVMLNEGVQEIVGGQGVEGVVLRNGRRLPCDTVVLAVGIKPNIELARDAGLKVGRGVRVDDRLRTNDPHVYAVGECAEHRGQVYGLVGPGLEQAAVAAHSILGSEVRYNGSIASARLKVIGKPVFSAGRVGEEENPLNYTEVRYTDHGRGVYRKLVLRNRRLQGAIALADWDELGRVQEAVTHGRRVWPWQVRRFQRSGRLWPETEGARVADWPAAATVCNCTGVTRGRLGDAMRRQGCATVEDLARCTGASTVCGSCKPLLADLLGGETIMERTKAWGALTFTVIAAGCIAAIIAAAGPYPYAESAQGLRLDLLWRDGLWKQVSGFTLLGLTLLGLILSLRKRWTRIRFGDFAHWRVVHTGLGLATLAVLAAHTGLHLGVNLNLALMAGFLGTALVGALAGGVVAAEHRLPGRLGRRLRQWLNWGHLLAAWPVPALLGYHILSVYYF